MSVSGAAGMVLTPPLSATSAVTVTRPSLSLPLAGKFRQVFALRVQPLDSTLTTPGRDIARKRTRNAGNTPDPDGVLTEGAPSTGQLHCQLLPSNTQLGIKVAPREVNCGVIAPVLPLIDM